MGKKFVGQRRLISSVASGLLTFIAAQKLLGLQIEGQAVQLLLVSSILGPIITKYVHDQLPAGKSKGI